MTESLTDLKQTLSRTASEHLRSDDDDDDDERERERGGCGEREVLVPVTEVRGSNVYRGA